ncbi:MAG: hypothetical protein LBB38_04680, partial [Puniceicoccales bacterium]|nr:hypothetical protein [Puniceicoccales bacterium]
MDYSWVSSRDHLDAVRLPPQVFFRAKLSVAVLRLLGKFRIPTKKPLHAVASVSEFFVCSGWKLPNSFLGSALLALSFAALLPTSSYGAGITATTDGNKRTTISYDGTGNSLEAEVNLTNGDIKVSAGTPRYAIQFASDLSSHISFFLGPIVLSIRNDSGELREISVDGTTQSAAATIDFNGLNGADAHPICINFADSVGGYKISASASGKGVATFGSIYDSSGAISGRLSKWAFGNFKGCNFSASGTSTAIFGIGYYWDNVTNSFNNWTFGDFEGCDFLALGQNATYAEGASAFGSGYCSNNKSVATTENSFNNWAFGKFHDGNVICAVANGTSNSLGDTFGLHLAAFATAFGPAGDQTTDGSSTFANSFQNWSAEFVGSQTVAALAYCKTSATTACANCLGGWTNGDMRFYFNNLDGEENPTVTVAGAKFGGLTFSGGTESKYASLSLLANQGNGTADDGWAKAVSLGNRFQLNVGRTREMQDGWEMESSRESGGRTAQGAPGILNLIGAVSRTPYANKKGIGEPDDTVLRIDGGWTVNCFSPVRDLRTIDLINGRLVLVSANTDDGANWNVFKAAADELGRKIIIKDDSGGIYRGDADDETIYPARAGHVELSFDAYPVRGSLTISADDTLKFHISENTFAGDEDCAGKLFATYADGYIELLGTENSMITFVDGWSLAVETGGIDIPKNAMAVIVRAQGDIVDDSILHGIDFEAGGTGYDVFDGGNVGLGDGVDLYRATTSAPAATGFFGEDPDVEGALALYLFEGDGISGLALAAAAIDLSNVDDLDQSPSEGDTSPTEEDGDQQQDQNYLPGVKFYDPTENYLPNRIVYGADAATRVVTVNVAGGKTVNDSYGIQFDTNLQDEITSFPDSVELHIANSDGSRKTLSVNNTGASATAIDFNNLSGTESCPICVVFDDSDGGYKIEATGGTAAVALGSVGAVANPSSSASNTPFGDFPEGDEIFTAVNGNDVFATNCLETEVHGAEPAGDGAKILLQHVPIAALALNELQTLDAMVAASRCDGDGIFCRAFAAVSHINDIPPSPSELHGRSSGIAIGYARRLRGVHSTLAGKIFAAAASGKLFDEN